MSLRGAALIAAGAALIVALVLWGALRAPDNDRQTLVATTYSSGEYGAKALYLLLQQSDITVARMRRFPPDEANAGTVLWILSPMALPPADADALIDFVKGGETLVAPPDLLADLLARSGVSGIHVEKSACTQEPCAIQTGWKLGFTAAPASLRHLAGIDPDQVYASSKGEPIVARYALGDGSVVSIGALDSLRNHAIGGGDAGPFWVRLAAALGERHAFDELHTGYGDLNLITLIWRAPYRWAALDLAFVLAVGVWGVGSRTRRADADPPTRRRETKDHVQAVADWWGRSGDLGLPLAALLVGLDARAAGRMQAAGGHNFVAWAAAVRPELGARATEAWQRAERLLALTGKAASPREVVTTAAELRAIEREVFQC